MSGYSKRMMEMARPWVESNPVPFAGKIRVPRKYESAAREKMAMRAEVDRFRGKADARLIDEYEGLISKTIDTISEASALDDELERILNKGSGPATSAHTIENEDVLIMALGSWLLSWAHTGYNVFDLSPDFVAALLLTDPDTLEVEEFRLPFRGLLVLLPDGFVQDSHGGSFTKVHVCELHNESGNVLDITASSGKRALSTSAQLDCVTLHGLSAFGEDAEWGVADDLDRQAIRTLQHIAIGMAAYIASIRGAAAKREDGRRRKSSDRPRPTYWDIARTVRIDPNLVRSVRAGAREVAFHLKHRHIVRGHYRSQPIGEGRKERKTIWIAPFWKGPADGAALVHTYKPSAPEAP